jgi:ParB family transcriptional regulator, chromosome partitioning protein
MEIKDIDMKEIILKGNIRRDIDDDDIKNLMQTIKDNGLLQPIGVKEEKEGYTILWGNRRLNACKKLGWKTISAVILSKKDDVMTEEQFIVLNLTENIQNKPLSLFELGTGVKLLRKTMSISEISIRLGVPKSRIENALSELQRLPPEWQKRVKVMDGQPKKGMIPMATAVTVSRLRALSAKDKGKLLSHISKNEESNKNVELIGSLLESGKNLNRALKEKSKYKSIGVQFYVNKTEFEKLMTAHYDEYHNNIEFVVKCINKLYPNLALKTLRAR